MNAQNTLTFIISRNYGHPISFSIPVWRVYLGGALLILLLGAMFLASVLFLGTFPHMQELERERDELKSERDALREQILSSNQRLYDLKEKAAAAGAPGSAGSVTRSTESEDSTESEYLPPILISSIKTLVSSKWVEVVFRIVSQGDPVGNRGGFLIAVFENHDANPARYATSPPVEVNADGFPATYKTGIRFPRVRKAVTYRRKIRRKSQEDYFTHVTLYLFSLRGGLLVKDRYELERDLFTRGTTAGNSAGANSLA